MSRAKRACGLVVAAVFVVAGATLAAPASRHDRDVRVAAGGSGEAPPPARTLDATDAPRPREDAQAPAASSTSTTAPRPATRATPPTTTRAARRPAPTTTTVGGNEAALPGPYVPKEPYPHVRGGGRDGKLPAGGSVYPFDARRTVFEASTGGYRLRVRLDPPAPKAGDVVHFYTEIETPPGADCCIIAGQGMVLQRDSQGQCPTGPIHDLVDVFNQAGRHEFQVQIHDCSTFSKTLVWLLGQIEVTPGVGTRQGPQLPTVEAPWPQAPGPDMRTVRLPTINAGDRDGWIAGLRIDWGDGTPIETYPGDPTPCRSVVPNGWPEPVGFHTQPVSPGSMGWVPYQGPEHFDHTYAGPGTYTVTVTAVSTACDATSMPQEGSTRLTWQVPDRG